MLPRTGWTHRAVVADRRLPIAHMGELGPACGQSPPRECRLHLRRRRNPTPHPGAMRGGFQEPVLPPMTTSLGRRLASIDVIGSSDAKAGSSTSREHPAAI
jgi:hypothetical protein